MGPWIGNMLRKIGNNMKVFNDRQRKIGYPEVHFDTLDIELAPELSPSRCGPRAQAPSTKP